MGRAQGGRACWDGQPLAQIGIVRDDICADQALPGRKHFFRNGGATGNGLRLGKQSISGIGHHFLDRFGQFPTIESMLKDGKATVVLASGELTEVTAERIRYSAETVDQFKQTKGGGMIAGSAPLKPAAKKSELLGEFSVAATIIAVLTCLPLTAARADGPFNLTADQFVQMLEELPIGGVMPIEGTISNKGIQKICLVSTDTYVMVDEVKCGVDTSSLLAVRGYGECSMIDLASVTSRILSGSIETMCRPVSTSLAVRKIDRFGQKHIVFNHE